jgi:putative oxidoreductase
MRMPLAQSRATTGMAAVAVRLAVGVIIAYHGWQKLDGGVSNFAGFIESLDLPAPTVLVYIVTTLELVGGIMIVIGLLTRLPALLLAIEMLFTAFLVKVNKLDLGLIAPGDAPGTGVELDLLILAGALALVLMGPGPASVDRALGIESEPAAYEEASTRRRVEPSAA